MGRDLPERVQALRPAGGSRRPPPTQHGRPPPPGGGGLRRVRGRVGDVRGVRARVRVVSMRSSPLMGSLSAHGVGPGAATAPAASMRPRAGRGHARGPGRLPGRAPAPGSARRPPAGARSGRCALWPVRSPEAPRTFDLGSRVAGAVGAALASAWRPRGVRRRGRVRRARTGQGQAVKRSPAPPDRRPRAPQGAPQGQDGGKPLRAPQGPAAPERGQVPRRVFARPSPCPGVDSGLSRAARPSAAAGIARGRRRAVRLSPIWSPGARRTAAPARTLAGVRAGADGGCAPPKGGGGRCAHAPSREGPAGASSPASPNAGRDHNASRSDSSSGPGT